MDTDTLVSKGKKGKDWLFNSSSFICQGKCIRTIANDAFSQDYAYFDFYGKDKTSVSNLDKDMQ